MATMAQKLEEYAQYINEYGQELTPEEIKRDYLVMVHDFDVEEAENLEGEELEEVYNEYRAA